MKLPAPQGVVHSTVYITGPKSEREDRGSYKRTFPPVGGHQENWEGAPRGFNCWTAERWVTVHNRESSLIVRTTCIQCKYSIWINTVWIIRKHWSLHRRYINGTRSVTIHKTICCNKYDGKRLSRLPATRTVCFQHWFRTLYRQVHSS